MNGCPSRCVSPATDNRVDNFVSTLLFCLTHFSPYGIWDRLRSPDDPIFYKLKNLDGWLC